MLKKVSHVFSFIDKFWCMKYNVMKQNKTIQNITKQGESYEKHEVREENWCCSFGSMYGFILCRMWRRIE